MWRQRRKRNEYPFYLGFGDFWNGRKQGRYWKRMLSKSRRRGWKQGRAERDEPYSLYRGQRRYECECNYKCW